MDITKNELLLLSGADIPFAAGQLVLHQPTLKEISYLGEASFFVACDILTFSKEKKFSIEDKKRLSNYSNFNILMSAMTSDKGVIRKEDINVTQTLLEMIFPNYIVNFIPSGWIFTDKETKNLVGQINEDNFEQFSSLINKMFCLSEMTGQTEYRPANKTAERIANKFRAAQQKLAATKGNTANKIAVYSRYASILAISEKISLNTIMDYTVYQLFDQFRRSSLKNEYEVFIKARLAGAKDMKEPEDWRKDLDEVPKN